MDERVVARDDPALGQRVARQGDVPVQRRELGEGQQAAGQREEDVAEENENNNRVPITITTVREVNTVPSFSLSLMSMTLSGLLAAVGIALRQKEEE